MIAHPPTPVKSGLTWIEAHPRTGWYIATIVTIDLVMEILGKLF